uniref:STIL N-terminal domain-containing protein n=1 Tax=Hyaloperonospora arabidopsidis (strain Emoy2) TaxID=559515 RepID=M4B2G6_HYAAE
MRSHGLFAQFDDELQDSDQTISPPVRHLHPYARPSTVDDATNSSSSDRASPSRRRFPTSAFFSDTTDDDVSRPTSGLMDHSIGSYSRFSNRRRSQGRQNSVSHGLRLRVDAIQFPMTRSVLWDRRRLSDAPVSVSFEHVLPQFSVSAEALKEIYKLCRENKRGTLRISGATLCFLHGEAMSPRIKRVRLEGVKLKKEDACAAGTWCIPVYLVAAKNALGQTQENYVSTIAAVLNSYRDDYIDSLSSKLQPKLLVSQLSPHAAQLDFQLECVASPVLFKFSLIRNLPLLMTPLAASLSKREFSTQTGSLRSGYLTLDQTRKAVPLLKVDPLVSQQPLVGVWVYGVHIDDAWNEEAAWRQLADPHLYFACIGYLMSETIKERVGPQTNTFLVALYPADHSDTDGIVGLLPRFFECAFSESLSLSTRLLPLELFSQRRSCFVGLSKFSSDLELTLSAAPTSEWKAAACQGNIPAIVYTKEGESAGPREPQLSACSTSRNSLPRSQNKSQCIDDEDEHKSVTRGWTVVTSDAIRKSAVPDPNAQSQTGLQGEKETYNRTFISDSETHTAMPPNALHDATCTQVAERIPCLTTPNKTNDAAQHDRVDKSPSNNRSCCKTQQLLTIQHQQILENQQRQLHEMQEQIVQMRRILNATHNETKRGVLSTLSADGGYVSDASTSGTGAVANVFNVTGTSSRHENDHLGSQFSVVSTTPRQRCNGSFLDEWSIRTRDNDDDVQERGNKDLSLSSLSLSSISCDSAADLSSLSSSLVGEQNSTISSTRSRKRTLDGEQVDVCTQALDQSRLPKSDTAAAQVDNTNAEVDKSSGNEFDAHDGADSSIVASNVSVDKLDSDLDEQAFSIIGKSGMGSVEYKEDSPAKAVERLLSPDTYLRKVGGFVDHHGGCFTTPPLDFHSFCVPRIKFLSETPEFDSDDEEIRLIEQKYTRLMAASQR